MADEQPGAIEQYESLYREGKSENATAIYKIVKAQLAATEAVLEGESGKVIPERLEQGASRKQYSDVFFKVLDSEAARYFGLPGPSPDRHKRAKMTLMQFGIGRDTVLTYLDAAGNKFTYEGFINAVVTENNVHQFIKGQNLQAIPLEVLSMDDKDAVLKKVDAGKWNIDPVAIKKTSDLGALLHEHFNGTLNEEVARRHDWVKRE